MVRRVNNNLGNSMLPELTRDKLKQGIRVGPITSLKGSLGSYQPHPLNNTVDYKKPSLKQIVMNHQMGRSKISSLRPQNLNYTVNSIPEESEREQSFVQLNKSQIEKIGRQNSMERKKQGSNDGNELVENYLKGLSSKRYLRLILIGI